MKRRAKAIVMSMVFALAMVLTTVFSVPVSAAEVPMGYSDTIPGADAYVAPFDTDLVITLNGAEKSYISFVTPAEEGYIDLQVKNASVSEGFVATVMTASGSQISNTTLSSNSSKTWNYKSEVNSANSATFEPGQRYYICFSKRSYYDAPVGSAKVMLTFVRDINPNGRDSAETIALNQEYVRSLDSTAGTDIDYFKFTANSTGKHQITLTNAATDNVNIKIKKGLSQEIILNKSVSASKTDSFMFDAEGGQDYWVEITNASWCDPYGQYTFKVSDARVQSITLAATSKTLKPGDTFELKPVVTPVDAINGTLKYKVDNTSVVSMYTNDGYTVKAVNSGKATVTIMTEDETVKATCVIYVTPYQAYMPNCAKYTSNSIKLSWSKRTGDTGYMIYQKKGKTWKKIGSTKKSYYTVKKLKATTAYQFKIAAYKKVDGKTLVGQKSDTAYACTKPASTKITSIKKSKSMKKYSYYKLYYATIKWKKVKGATSYKLYAIDPSSNGSKKYIGLYKGTTAKNISFAYYGSGSKTCTFYVVPVKSYKGNDYMGSYSKGKKYTFK